MYITDMHTIVKRLRDSFWRDIILHEVGTIKPEHLAATHIQTNNPCDGTYVLFHTTPPTASQFMW